MRLLNGTVQHRVGIVPVAFEELRELLGLPRNAFIRSVHVGTGDRHNMIWVKVEHPDLPPIEEGYVVPPCPRIRRKSYSAPCGGTLRDVPVDGWPNYEE